MKLNKILISGLSLIALTACNDYLDVEAPSKFTPEQIYISAKDAGTALNGVYAEVMSGNVFGQAYTYSLILNSDVDFVTSSSENEETNTPKRYNQTAASSTANSVWNATYKAIETANEFIYYLDNSSIYDENNDDYPALQQYMGEAKVLRAMLYNELICYWGDVPFMMDPTSVTNDFYPLITSRDEIAKEIMEDLIEIAPYMKPASAISEGIERASQEACWALIARIGLQAAGYSLRHNADDATSYGYMGKPSAEDEEWFLTQAYTYSKKVIDSGTHSLKTPFQDVFLNECNFKVVNDDDPIFELPFTKESSGYIGYRQGPKFESSGGSTNFQWGECGGNQQVSAFYRFSFKPGDTRANTAAGWWSYTYDGIPTINRNITLYNNKWSKMFNNTNAFSKITTSNTGINYPYIRYADVLLMFAEADLKLNDVVSSEAISAVQQVRDRAYLGSTVSAPKVEGGNAESFLKEILLERKWEFAGENSRWKDLVRNNMLAEELYYTFLRNWSIAAELGGISETSVHEMVAYHDNVDYFGGILGETYTQEEIDAAIPGDNAYGATAGTAKKALVPSEIYYIYIYNPADNSYFANHEMPTLYLFNPSSAVKYKNEYNNTEKFFKYLKANHPNSKVANYKVYGDYNDPAATLKYEWKTGEFSWFEDELGYAKNPVLYSLYGYINADPDDKTIFRFNRNGVYSQFDITVPQTDLPVVRYLMPIPNEAITRSQGTLKNYYGY